jgi:hypothetical protein
MSTILGRLKQTGAAMDTDEFRVPLGLKLKKAAIEAIMAGIGSKEWRSYMSLFADNADQLTRLTVRAENEDSLVLESRAYMVANSVCGADSTTQTSLNVNALIDAELVVVSDNQIIDPPENGEAIPDGVTVRPFRIPKV